MTQKLDGGSVQRPITLLLELNSRPTLLYTLSVLKGICNGGSRPAGLAWYETDYFNKKDSHHLNGARLKIKFNNPNDGLLVLCGLETYGLHR